MSIGIVVGGGATESEIDKMGIKEANFNTGNE